MFQPARRITPVTGSAFDLLFKESVLVVIRYSDALCGAGKTWWACQIMAGTPGRYLYAVDRRDVFATRADLVRRFAVETGTEPKIVELYSRTEQWTGGIVDVRRAVREAACQYAAHPHVIVLITHEALKSCDLSTYGGWTCIVDEVPSIWVHGEIKSPASCTYLAASYNLRPIGSTGWSEVQAKADGALLTDIHSDSLLSGLAELHRHVRDRGVFASIEAWEDTADGRSWSWVSIWSPETLNAFGAVFLLGNAFEDTLTHKLITKNFPDVKLVPFSIPLSTTVWQPRRLTVRYFACAHRAGSTFWNDSPDGQECLSRVLCWLQDNSDAQNHYWSSNIAVERHPQARGIVGQRVSPKIAGVNDLRHLTCGSFIYTAKPSANERLAFELFSIDSADIVRSREHEDLIQMLWRSSLRDPHDGRPVEFRVYDWWQAEFLREFVDRTAPHVTVAVEQIDLGLDAFRPRPRGRPKAHISETERQAKAGRVREQARERQRRHRAGR